MLSQHVRVELRVYHVLRPRLQREARDGHFLTGTVRPRIRQVNVAGLDVKVDPDVTIGTLASHFF